MKTSKSFAFFDLDHTLIPVDSSGLWSYFLISKTGDKAREYEAYQQSLDEDYRQGRLDILKFMDFEMSLLAQFPRKELEEFRKIYIDTLIKPHIQPIAVDLINRHKKAGDKVVIVTATYRFVVEPIAKLLGADALIAAEQEEDRTGEFTGGWTRHNFQGGKIEGVRELVMEQGNSESLKHSWFYSDSINDFPLLDFVSKAGGKAVATNPDAALRKEALQRDWEILELFPVKDASMETIAEKSR